MASTRYLYCLHQQQTLDCILLMDKLAIMVEEWLVEEWVWHT